MRTISSAEHPLRTHRSSRGAATSARSTAKHPSALRRSSVDAHWSRRFAKPVDEALLTTLLDAGVRVVTLEDHSIKGGFGTQVLEAANRLGLDSRLITVRGMPDGWIYQGSRSGQLAEVGLDAESIARAIRTTVDGAEPADTSRQAPSHAAR